MNRDVLSNADTNQVARTSMAIIDRIQAEQPHNQMLGIAAAFVLLAEHWGINPKELFSISTNIMNYAEGRKPEFSGIADYMKHEL